MSARVVARKLGAAQAARVDGGHPASSLKFARDGIADQSCHSSSTASESLLPPHTSPPRATFRPGALRLVRARDDRVRTVHRFRPRARSTMAIEDLSTTTIFMMIFGLVRARARAGTASGDAAPHARAPPPPRATRKKDDGAARARGAAARRRFGAAGAGPALLRRRRARGLHLRRGQEEGQVALFRGGARRRRRSRGGPARSGRGK